MLPALFAMLGGHFGLGPALGRPRLAWPSLASPVALHGVALGTSGAPQGVPKASHGMPKASRRRPKASPSLPKGVPKAFQGVREAPQGDEVLQARGEFLR